MKEDKSFKWNPQSVDEAKLDSLKVAIVGGTGGLGRAIARALASRGAQVTVIGQTFKDNGVKNIDFIKGDLSLIETAKKVAEQLPADSLDILLFTTGIFASRVRQETPEGLERDMAVSYLNRLAMLKILVPKLKKEKNSLGLSPRIFLMGYPGSGELGTIDDLNQEKSYAFMKAHMNTLAGNEALVLTIADRYPNQNIYGLNPGIVKTNIRDNLLGASSWKSYFIEGIIGLFTKTPEQYASSIVPLLIAPELDGRSGTFYNDKGNAIFGSEGLTKEYAASYIKASEGLLKEKGLED